MINRQSPTSAASALVVRVVLVAALTVMAAASCSGSTDSGRGNGEDEVRGILVFAAASLTDAFTEIETEFETANPDVDVQLNLAGSSTLREQILGGAPADVFASASEPVMAEVVDAGETGGAATLFARNRLMIAVPAGNPGSVAGLSEFADDELIIGLCAQGVPCGDAARQVLHRAGVEPSIDTNEPDVRALLTKITADEVDAGLVYTTDVMAAGQQVEGLAIPANQNVTVDYPIAAVANGANRDGATAFIEFVLSDQGQAVLARHGFDRP